MGGAPFFPARSESPRDRCRWSGAEGSRAAAVAVAPARGAWAPARSGSGSFGGGGRCCRAVPPVNCLRPRAARPHSAEGRREPSPGAPRPAEGRGEPRRFRVSAGGDSGSASGPTPLAFARSAEAAPGGARGRRPSFLPPARPRS